MSLSLSDVLSVASIAQWEAQILGYASSLGLTATAWQPGAIARTMIAVFARALNAEDQVTYGIAAGGYLDTAATVTPEGGPGWLDLVAEYVFGVTREAATQGASTVAITNTGAAIGPLPIGTYHLSASSGHTYRNATAITLGTGSTTIDVVCDQFGVSDGAGTVLSAITTYSGVTPGTLITDATGRVVETNAELIQRCKLKLAALAPRLGGSSSYVYFATTTTEPGYPTLVSNVTRARAFVNPITGVVEVYLANATGGSISGDVALMQAYLDAVATPDAVTMICSAAVNFGVTTTMQVYCPVAYAGQVSADVTNAVDAYLASLPIGGVNTEGSFDGVPFNGLEDYVARAVPYIRTQTTTLNGGSVPLLMNVNEVAVSSGVTVTYAGA